MSALAAIAEDVYTFDQLSEEAKERARDSWREDEARDFQPEYESYETAAKLLGIDLTERRTRRNSKNEMVAYTANTIQYSGFWSQGDGASFTGTFTFVPGCCDSIRSEFPQDTTLHRIADKLTALHNTLRLLKGEKLSGKITQKDSHYSHSGTMDAVVYDSEGEEYSYDDPVTKAFIQLMRDFADWIYKEIEADYDYITSDEAINERLTEDGDYEFTEEGEMI